MNVDVFERANDAWTFLQLAVLIELPLAAEGFEFRESQIVKNTSKVYFREIKVRHRM